jgi:hypothetical protein
MQDNMLLKRHQNHAEEKGKRERIKKLFDNLLEIIEKRGDKPIRPDHKKKIAPVPPQRAIGGKTKV